MEKKKIFPSFRRQNKWLGIIDYKTLALFGVYLYVIYLICNLIGLSSSSMTATLIVSSVPMVAILFVNSKDETAIDILITVVRFYFSKKTYYYLIEEKIEFDLSSMEKKKKFINIDKVIEWLKI